MKTITLMPRSSGKRIYAEMQNPLKPMITEKPSDVEARVWRMAPGPNRQKERSRFFKGIAKAMAEQWG